MDNLLASIQDDLNVRDQRILGEIREAVQAKHYHIACTKVFEATHPANGSVAETINHPNQYFEMSFRLDESQNTGS